MAESLELVGMHEVADLLGISRQRVHRIRAADPTFPPPAADLKAGLVWRREDVEAWARATGRIGSGQA